MRHSKMKTDKALILHDGGSLNKEQQCGMPTMKKMSSS